MKKKKYLILIAAVTISAAFLFNGCGLGSENSSEPTVSAETENLTDGDVQVHSRWYNDQNAKLASAVVAIYDGDDKIFEETTDENGNLAPYTLSANTKYRCVVTDAAGTTLAESEIIYKVSSDYPSLSVVSAGDEENRTQEINLPSDKTNVNAAIFVTADKTVSHANLTTYTEDTTTQAADPNAQTADPNAQAADPNAQTADPNAQAADPNAQTADPNTQPAAQ